MHGVFESVDHSFPDAREFDIRKCCRMFGNCAAKTPTNGLVIGSMNVWNPTIGGGGNLSLVADYSSDFAQKYGLAIPITTGLRVAVSDRVGGQNSNLMAGQFEMDCTARVKFVKTNADETVPRIGFSAGHITYVPNVTPFYACICFTTYGSEANWFAHLSVNGQGGYGDPFFQEKRIDTGVRTDGWSTLHVWVRRDGKQAQFWANGRLVHNEIDPAFIPRRDNFVGNVNMSEEVNISGNGSTLNNGGITLRGVQTFAQPATLEVDWVRTRYFLKR
jgi:hypothetical protein